MSQYDRYSNASKERLNRKMYKARKSVNTTAKTKSML